MKKRFRDTEAWKWVRTFLELLAIAAIIISVILVFRAMGISEAYADGYIGDGYIICKPGDYVNIRPHPNKKGEELGRLDPGDVVHLDGREKNGYLHCVDLSLEMNEGWVFAGYVVYDRPEYIGRKATVVSRGRLAARRYVGGKRIKWLQPMSTLTVWFWSDEWCMTSAGYVQSQYLELDGE